jgi:hypothetical protein
MISQPLQNPGEHGIMHLKRQAAPGARQPGMVRHRITLAEAEELPQGQAVGAAPLQTALAVDPLEIADLE